MQEQGLNHQATVAGDMKDVLHRSPATDNISTELLAQKISHRFFPEVWGINDEQVLPTGMPRMDEYLDEQHRNEKIKRIV